MSPAAATVYHGDGMQQVLPGKTASTTPASFVLNMQRAPALKFHLL
jgi:hypothetical protein